MSGATDDLLPVLRRIRALSAGDADVLARALLDLLREATGADAAVLRRAGQPDTTSGGDAAGGSRLELSLGAGEPGASLVLSRGAAFGADEAARAEILGGEVLLRVSAARTASEARRATRQLALLDSVARGEGETVDVSATAARAVRALRESFSGVSIALHLAHPDRLELVARQVESGESRLDAAPEWLRDLPVDSKWLQPRAARERKTFVTPVADLPEPARPVLERAGAKHLVVVPLVHADRVVGTLSITHANATAWDAEQMLLVEGLVMRLAAELAHLQRLEEEQRRSRDLALVNEIGSLVAQELDLDAVLRTAVHELGRVVEVPRVTLVLADEAAGTLRMVAGTQPIDPVTVIRMDEPSTAALAFTSRAPVQIEDAAEDPRAHRAIVQAKGVRSALAVPLIAKGKPIGAIVLSETRRQRRFTDDEIRRATAVANLVSPAITNARMFEDLRKSYEALARAQEGLVRHERLAALGELSAVIAHEVRNPLAILFNSLGSLRRLTPPGPDALMLLDIMGEEAARLNRIVGDLLDFVRPYSPHPRPAQLDALVDGAIDGARRAVPGSAGITIATTLDAGVGERVVDATMLQQALINLIVNALQATPAGGTVSVRVQPEDAEGQARLRFEVEDDGPGIETADVPRIFQPFFTTKATGTGLGLAVVRRIADALGGRVEATPARERGSLFTLVVSATPSVPPAAVDPPGPGC